MLDQWLCLLDVLLWMLKLQLWLGSPVVLGPDIMEIDWLDIDVGTAAVVVGAAIVVVVATFVVVQPAIMDFDSAVDVVVAPAVACTTILD